MTTAASRFQNDILEGRACWTGASCDDMNTDTPSATAPHSPNATLLALSALGVVFGDIGPSPLYAFKNSFVGDHKLSIDFVHVMGVMCCC